MIAVPAGDRICHGSVCEKGRSRAGGEGGGCLLVLPW